MKRNIRKLTALVLAALLCIGCIGCSAVSDTLAVTLVQGNLDAIYRNEVTDNYLKLVDSDRNEIEELYIESLEATAEGFAYYFDISYLSDELEDEIVDLYKDIFDMTKYTVGDASKVNDNTYAVNVTIEPLNIFELVVDDFDELLDTYNAKYADIDTESLTEEQYMEIDADYASMVMELVKSKLSEAGYGEPVSMLISVECVDDVWSISNSSLADFDTKLITYP